MAKSEGDSPSMAEDQENAPKKESAEFVVEVGTICFGKVAEKWFEGQIMHVNAKKSTVLFRVTRSAIGRVNFVDVANPMIWIPNTDLHTLDTDPSDGAEVRRAKTWAEQEPPLKKKNLDYKYGTQTVSYSVGGSSYWVQNERASCGFAGLKNQGATCYLNSLLQSYYMTPRLREALFRFRYDENSKEPKERCVPYQLQRLFAHMQLCKMQATDTKGLTDSFGWKAEDVYQQHDVVELATILLSHLEERTKDENLINIVKEYKVATADYVKCLTCGYRSERPDVMVAVQLNIENVKSMEESLKNFCTPETLDGDNAYMCSKCESKQPAKKGIRFTKFKDFVAFQLNRWTLDWATLERKKIRDKINFPLRINMSKYLADPSLDDANDEEREAILSQPKSSIAWKLSMQGVKDPAALMKDFEFAVANTVGTTQDEVSISVLESNDDGECVLQVDVHSRDHQSVSSILEEREAFANSFMRHMQTHAGDRGVDLGESLQLTEVGQASVTELKQEYELYGMMIHRGGAYGGHYFAYIKHPKEERYFVFNDSRVEEIEPDELAEMFDENCAKPKRDSPLSGAYMLLYRRVGCASPECNPELLPQEIRDEIAKANEQWEKRAADRKARDLEVSIQVHYNGEKEKVKMEKTDLTKAALSKARLALKVDPELDDDLFRLRFCDRGKPKTPLSDPEKTLADWNVRTNSTQLYLEQRESAEAEFSEYTPTLKTIHLKIVNPDSDVFCLREERDVDVIKRGTIGDLRRHVSEILEVESKTIKLWKKRPNQTLPEALDDDSSPVQWINREVFVEFCEDYSVKHASYKTKTHFQELSYQSEIKYITFDSKVHTLMFDNRKKLGELRAHFAEMLDRDPYSFCMEREPLSTYYAKWTDLSSKDNDTLRQLEFASRFRQPKLRLVDKPGLKPGEMRIKLKFQNPEGEWITYTPPDSEDDVSDNLVVVNTNFKYEEAREFFAQLKPFGEPLDPQKLRIRKIWPNSESGLGALDETMTLGDLNVYEKMWMGIQILKEPEVLKKTDRVVMICQWFPEKKKCGPKVEMKIDATMKVKDGTLSKWFEEKFNIEAEHVRFQKTHHYYISNGQCANLDWELVEIPASATLVRQPVLLKHGDNIVYKDNREKETGAVYVKRQSFKFRSAGRAERGIKIHAFGEDKESKKDDDKPSGGAAPAENESGEEEVAAAEDEEKMTYIEENPKIEEMTVIHDYVSQGAMG